MRTKPLDAEGHKFSSLASHFETFPKVVTSMMPVNNPAMLFCIRDFFDLPIKNHLLLAGLVGILGLIPVKKLYMQLMQCVPWD